MKITAEDVITRKIKAQEEMDEAVVEAVLDAALLDDSLELMRRIVQVYVNTLSPEEKAKYLEGEKEYPHERFGPRKQPREEEAQEDDEEDDMGKSPFCSSGQHHLCESNLSCECKCHYDPERE